MVCGGTIGFSIGVCSGNGVCVNSSCVCSGTYSGRNPYFDVGDEDCLTSELAIQILHYLSSAAYIARILLAIILIIKIPFTKLLHNSVGLHVCLWMLSGVFGSVFSLLITQGYYLTDSWVTLVFIIGLLVSSFLLASLNGSILFQAYQRVPGVSQKTRTFSKVYFLVGLFGIIIILASLIVIRIIQNGSIQMISLRILICVTTIQCFIWQFSVDFFAHLIYNILKESPANEHYILKLKKFRRSSLIMNTIANISLCTLAIFPHIYTYFLAPLEILTTLINYDIFQRYLQQHTHPENTSPNQPTTKLQVIAS